MTSAKTKPVKLVNFSTCCFGTIDTEYCLKLIKVINILIVHSQQPCTGILMSDYV